MSAKMWCIVTLVVRDGGREVDVVHLASLVPGGSYECEATRSRLERGQVNRAARGVAFTADQIAEHGLTLDAIVDWRQEEADGLPYPR